METTHASSPPRLKSELARLCLPGARRDPNRKLAWVNSVCLVFLLIGVTGLQPVALIIKRPPPLQQNIPVIIEPTALPPTRVEARSDEKPVEHSEAPQVVAVVAMVPAINFSVPTIGNLITPMALAVAPPSNPLTPLVAPRREPSAIHSTGTGGERPDPPYPKIAHDLGQQGTVVLSLTVDENGRIASLAVKESSGSPVLDRGTLEFVKRHWLLPAGVAGRIFEAPIHYVLAE
jgi:TonB family protein